MRKGIGVSPGVAVGSAYCVDEIFVDPSRLKLAAADVQAEWRHFEDAVERTIGELRSLQHKMAAQVGHGRAHLFQAQEVVLRDAAFVSKMRELIIAHANPAPVALDRVLREYGELAARTKDTYLRERLSDAHDAIIRLSGNLSPLLAAQGAPVPGPLVVVAQELLPWHIVAIGNLPIVGVVTQTGGETSHAAILARRRGIAAVTGVPGIRKQISNGDLLVVDGRDGTVVVNPDPEQESAYRKLEREFVDLHGRLAQNRDRPARTADGIDLELLANINGPDDAAAAKAMGAAGIGLYRTEYLFLAHQSVPSEEEQLETYRRVIAASPGRLITIRTLDLGGDKTIPFLGHDREANPFMGWRSIRLSFEHPELFLQQIRAVLRAAGSPEGAGFEVRLLFPMITTLEECRRVRSIVRKAAKQLKAEKRAFRTVPLGLMLEVPAAAFTIDLLVQEVDFVAIGSNDLVQYLMAADRDNPKVSHLCRPLSPPVLRLLARVVHACRAAKKPVALCGEMAGDPRAFTALVGMGLRSFSMSPALIPTIKDLAARLSYADAKELVRETLKLKTADRVQRYLADRLHDLAPNLDLLGSVD